VTLGLSRLFTLKESYTTIVQNRMLIRIKRGGGDLSVNAAGPIFYSLLGLADKSASFQARQVDSSLPSEPRPKVMEGQADST